MRIVNRLVYWVGLMIIVIIAILATYFVVIPLLLPSLWHAARLPLALLVGEAILIIAVVRVTERYVRARGDHLATDAAWPKLTQVSSEDSAFGRAICYRSGTKRFASPNHLAATTSAETAEHCAASRRVLCLDSRACRS